MNSGKRRDGRFPAAPIFAGESKEDERLTIHIVKPGETLYQIAQNYDIPLRDVIDANGLRNPDQIAVGQTIIIPFQSNVHIVRSGQSLYTIARHHGITLDELIAANPDLQPPYTIYPGQVIQIPGGTEKLGTIEVNGFLYSDITSETLNRTLPRLTYASIFSTNITASGGLVPPGGEERIISAARSNNVAPLMVLTNLEEESGFTSDTVAALLSSQAAVDRLIANVLEALRTKRYYGVNVDFEYIPPAQRENYIQFLRRLKSALQSAGYPLLVCLAPKLSDTQQGLLYEAHDYAAVGEIADRVILMTYEWGYIAGPPMAVSPYVEVRKVLDYAVSRIPAAKLLMSLPGYGYDWTLPFNRGDRARNLSITQATELAARYGAVIQFDEDAMTPFFTYYDSEGREHIVWFEDAVSADAKLRLMHEYGLAGVSYWTINAFWPQNWAALDALYDVKKVLPAR